MKINSNWLKIVFLFALALTILSCSNEGNKKSVDPRFIDLADGFYYLNGTDTKYMVQRDIEMGGNYMLNPNPIFPNFDFESIDIIKEENSNYSLSFELNDLFENKWAEVLNSNVHYIGFVNDNKLKHLLKIKGKNSSDAVYLNCVSSTKEGAEVLKKKLSQK